MEAFFSALLGGVLSTLPVGPINLVLIHLVMKRKLRSWIACVAGILLADAVYCLAALYLWDSSNELLLSRFQNLAQYGQWFLSGLFFLLGIRLLLRENDSPGEKGAKKGFFVFGFFATFFQPLLPVFWLGWWLKAASFTWNDSAEIILGLSLGDLLIFSAYAALGYLLPRPGPGTERWINRAIGLVFLAFAIGLFFFR